ncbi:MAG TPA: response regulator [Pirellulales bacterium]|nr:response regulator [Pirellulales bacterium]
MTRPTILIAEDDFELAQSLKLRCQQLGLDALRSPDALHALLGAHRLRPDIILTDVHMPSGNGLSLCEFLRCDSDLAGVPVIVMSGQGDAAMVERCRSMGVHFVKKGPQLWATLESLIVQLLGQQAHAPAPAAGANCKLEPADCQPPEPVAADPPPTERRGPRVMCIDDDPDVSKIIQMRLSPFGVEVQRAFKGMQGYWSSLDLRPDVIITDMIMPDGEGNYILSRIRDHSLTKDTPVIVLTGKRDTAIKREMLAMGANAYLHKPIDFSQLFEHLRQYIPLVPQTAADLAPPSPSKGPISPGGSLPRPRVKRVEHLETAILDRPTGGHVPHWSRSG